MLFTHHRWKTALTTPMAVPLIFIINFDAAGNGSWSGYDMFTIYWSMHGGGEAMHHSCYICQKYLGHWTSLQLYFIVN